MKRITCFIESLAPGGAQQQLVILAELLAEKGYDVTLVTYADVPDHIVVPDCVKRVKIKRCDVKGKYLNAFIKWFYSFRYLVSIPTDCFISYRQRCNARLLIPMFFRSRRVKVICSERNTTIVPTLYERILFSFLYRRSDFIVSNSRTQAEYIKKKKPNLVSKLKVIHNYTDLQKYKPGVMPKDKNLIKIAVFGRYDSQKNPVGFANVVKLLKDRTKQPFEIHWYGSKSRGELYEVLAKKIRMLEINDVFICHDAVKDPSSVINEYHAICLPSLFEGFSNSIAEGICSGKPMLVSDVSDNSLMVHNGVNGFLFNPADVESIGEAFIRFFSLTTEEMCEMAKKSREIAEGLFDKKLFIQRYIDLIETT